MSSKKFKQIYVPRFGSQSTSRNLLRKTKVDSDVTNVNITFKKTKPFYKDVSTLPKKGAVIAKTQQSPMLASGADVKKPNRIKTKKPSRSNSKSTCETDVAITRTVPQGTSDNGGVDIFRFIDKDDPLTANKTSRARESVLRTIARMLQENRQIRRRLEILSQQSQAVAGIN